MSTRPHSIILLLLLLLIFTSAIEAAHSQRTSRTDFIPCSESCNGGDVNYSLVASVRSMPMLNSTLKGRTYSTDSSPTFMGPTINVKPGQSLWIKLTNNLTDPIGPTPPSPTDYWTMLQNPGENIKYTRYKSRVSHPSQLQVDTHNMPKNFDSTNLHVHGLDVEVHMFDPINTHNPDAPHIAIQPNECYCYKFNIPSHHPPGMYWYHPHLHGSTAIQMWSGMIGLLYVDGPLDQELEDYGVTETHEFVIWDPAFRSVNDNTADPTHVHLEVDEFLLGQTTLSKIHPFTVNGQINPSFTIQVDQILHFKTLCATIENENTFIIYPIGKEHLNWEEYAIPFWIIASDGVTYSKPKKKKIVVLSGGQREEMLLRFDKPGRYVISQQGIQGLQFFDMRGHPHDQILATIDVLERDVDVDDPNVNIPIPIDEMEFTPGYKEEESIKASDIVASETIVFSMGAMFDQVPFPQYYVNGHPYDPNRIAFHAQPGEAREYTLINANHNAHPFHIHVNRFQVKEMGSELSKDTYPVLQSVLDYDPNVWRDTVMIPPNGRTKIWVQFKNYTGKTVIHCHFLAHEDTGMMSTLFIGKKDWVFRLEEHIQWILGIVAGVGLTTIALLVYVKRDGRDMYSVVNMNEIKAKTMD